MMDATASRVTARSDRLSAILSIVVAGLLLIVFVVSRDFPQLAGYFPQFASALGLLLAIGETVRVIRRRRAAKLTGDETPSSKASGTKTDELEQLSGPYVARAAKFLGWALLFPVFGYLIGFLWGILVWFPLFALVEVRTRPVFAAAGAGALFVVVSLLGEYANIRWPSGLLL